MLVDFNVRTNDYTCIVEVVSLKCVDRTDFTRAPFAKRSTHQLIQNNGVRACARRVKPRDKTGNADRSVLRIASRAVGMVTCAGRTGLGVGAMVGFCTYLGVSAWNRQKVSGSRQKILLGGTFPPPKSRLHVGRWILALSAPIPADSGTA